MDWIDKHVLVTGGAGFIGSHLVDRLLALRARVTVVDDFLTGFREYVPPRECLRVIQGVFMAAAFTLTLAYLSEQCRAEDTAGAFAAYITGNVASNLFGRLLAAALVHHWGVAANFYLFAMLNIAGALLVYASLHQAPPAAPRESPRS